MPRLLPCLPKLLPLLPGTQAAPAQAVSPAPPVAAPDTAAAIHWLFESRRKRRGFVVFGTAGAAFSGVAPVASLPAGHSGGRGCFSGSLLDNHALATAGLVVGTVPAVLAELVLPGGWGCKRKQRASEAWQQHRRPPRIRRQLRPRFFRPVHSS